MIAAILPSFHGLVKVLHCQPSPTNSGQLILSGSQTIWARSQLIGRAPDLSAPSIQDMGIHHRRADVLVPQEFLNRPDVIAILK